MPKEIERKFLLADDSWRAVVSRSEHLRDGLLAFFDGRKIRIRFYDEKATLTIKGPRHGLARDEFEYDIPASDGLILLEQHCKGEIIEKIRHYVRIDAHEWFIDEYRGLLEGIIIAEVEIPSEDTEIPLPSWVAREVTGLSKYRKANLVKARKKRIADAARRARAKG
jgi:Uncharacterized protein conserved in bacteria